MLEAGLSSNVIGGLIRRHRLFPIFTGVYAVGHSGPTPLGRETAALLAAPQGAVLSHASAAALWRLIAAPPEDSAVDVLALTSPRHRPGVSFHRTRCLRPEDRRVCEGLPVVSPARAIVEIAEDAASRTVERAIEQAGVLRLVRPGELERMAAAPAHGRAGPRRLRELLGAWQERTLTRSQAEELLLGMVREANLPHPAVNVRPIGFEVDFTWPRHRVVVEIDGFRFHSSRQAYERDRQRGAALAAAGYTLLRFTWRDLVRRPYTVIAQIAQALARAEGREAGTGRRD